MLAPALADQIRSALQCDRAIGAVTLLSHFDVSLEALQLGGFTSRVIESGVDGRVRDNHFRVFTAGSSELLPVQLRHLCGASATRLLLGVEPQHWSLAGEAGGETAGETGQMPDAVWLGSSGRIEDGQAVEFDSGRYSFSTLEAKMLSFSRRFSGQVWATTRPRRAADLRQLAQRLDLLASVHVVQWW